MRGTTGASLILSLLISRLLGATCQSPPGKPKLTSCRSPEKETFSCWWEPGSDGGLPTNYSLYYRKENSEIVYECPDYHTSGKNSCFFSKNDTSIWVNYNITVVATNSLGSNFSDSVDVDVMYIVQPHTPENVSVVLEGTEDNPFLLVTWEPPHKADTRSGWITLVYQLRVKLEKDDKWEEHFAGQQKQFNIFSLHSGEVYMVKVRCKPDHGFWSEWSTTRYVRVPDYISREMSSWILILTFSALICIVFVWTAHMKRNSVKHFLLPPVPGPKIKGFDTQQLKSGKSDEIFSTLVVQSFPPPSDYEDLLVEYLEVYDNEEQELVFDRKDQEGGLKSKSSSDTDSGRGSCDSHSLLMEKCSESREDQTLISQVKISEASQRVNDDSHAAECADVTTQTWPMISPYYHHDQKPCYQSIPEMSEQHCVLDSHLFLTQQQDYWETSAELDQKNPYTGYSCVQAYSEININGIAHAEPTSPQPVFVEYVEVQHVNQENTLILKAIAQEEHGQFRREMTEHHYSKVNGMVCDNVLLIQREAASQCLGDYQEEENALESCTQQTAGKPTVHPQVALAQEGLHITLNGYVDTTAIMSTY
ncbi:prolactin receptor a isoform X1 [Paramormyrops kingsleyae]|uniref:prolactin receptor a isoform X1 n=1 Tax=Paramormyrops kingsleyae TaxID=1676925 RepID=UPI003B96D00F